MKQGDIHQNDGVQYEFRNSLRDDRSDCSRCAFNGRGGCVSAPCGGGFFVVKPAEAAVIATAPKTMILPADPAARKGMPICTGVLDYFPLALAEVAKCSKAGNDQHNPGQPLHWDKSKSLDHADCIPRHLIDRGSFDSDGIRHSAKLAWRALALLQAEMEAEAC